jgi:RNA-binding protein
LCARKAFATFPDMTLSGRDRASLRAEAHHLTALVHIGQAGLSPTVIQSLDDTLRTHELVKVQIGKPVEMKAKDVAAALATATGAAVIQVIGKTATLYRRNPELERRKGEPPPWRTD